MEWSLDSHRKKEGGGRFLLQMWGRPGFIKMGNHLKVDRKYQSQGWDWAGFKARAGKVGLGIDPNLWR